MIRHTVFYAVIMLLGTISSCGQKNGNTIFKTFETEDFKKYWYSGTAEITSYQLTQSRYGERRDGTAVLIFVTEDFSLKKQVKLDNPANASKDKVSVMKLNFTKNFVTGIYPYSMMLSVFTPINRTEFANSLKVTASTQEWCGQVFTQMNLENSNYRVAGNSYFETEGDETTKINATLLEDELWNLIRLDPQRLPLGDIKIIPGLFFTRLKHSPIEVLDATATKTDESSAIIYRLNLPLQQRALSIRFNKEFPHQILGWEEAFTERGQPQKTTATLKKTMQIDYWTKNSNQFLYLRDSLGLTNPTH